MTSLLFVGDVVGEAGLAYLEHHLPAFISERRPDFVVANAEDLPRTLIDPIPNLCYSAFQGSMWPKSRV